MTIPSPSMFLTSAEVQLLTQVGYLAAGEGDVVRAGLIFAALRQERPDQPFALLGLPVALLNAGQAHAAAGQLQVIDLPPGDDADMVQAFLGLALQLDARAAQAQQVLTPLAQRAQTPETASPGARLAARLLGHDLPPGV